MMLQKLEERELRIDRAAEKNNRLPFAFPERRLLKMPSLMLMLRVWSFILKRNVWLALALGIRVRQVLPERFIYLHDYAFLPRRRYTELSPHPLLSQYLSTFQHNYEHYLSDALAHCAEFRTIPMHLDRKQRHLPHWAQQWFYGLDPIMLYTMIAGSSPKRFVEIGSGMSTKFARWAINRQQLNAALISIDPQPRAEIDDIADRVIRKHLEDVPLDTFRDMEPGDILFFDGSHRCFSNSDVTVFFLDVLPRLRPGVLIHVHDVFLPFDYPEHLQAKYYSEQYLLANLLLSASAYIEVLMASSYVLRELSACQSRPLCDVLRALYGRVEGTSFWFRQTQVLYP